MLPADATLIRMSFADMLPKTFNNKGPTHCSPLMVHQRMKEAHLFFRYEIDFGSQEAGVMKSSVRTQIESEVLCAFPFFPEERIPSISMATHSFYISGLQQEDCELVRHV